MVFPSKKDLWLVLLLCAAAAVQCGAVSLLFMQGPEWRPSLLLLAMPAFILWLMQSTYYKLDEEKLLIRSGPFWWTVLVNEIDGIRATYNPLSSPALSLDRLAISYQHRSRRRAIMISPQDKKGFLRCIAALRPDLKIELKS
jgi:hypothetical protein